MKQKDRFAEFENIYCSNGDDNLVLEVDRRILRRNYGWESFMVIFVI